MKRQYIWTGILMLVLCGCGVWMRQRAAAPMAERQGQVAASLTAVPEDLAGGELLVAAGNPLILMEKEGGNAVYEVMRNDYRRWTLPEDNTIVPRLITSAPDGGYWMVMGEMRLMKISAQGTVLIDRPLECKDVSDLVCDSVGRVYIITDRGTEAWRFSPEGELRETIDLLTEFETATLVVRKDRVFVAYFAFKQTQPQLVKYREITDEFELGRMYYGCVKVTSQKEVSCMGSFLPEYSLMEYDNVGLYACREDGDWETVCLWDDLHLDGVIRGRLLCDAQGRGMLLYEKNGETYMLTLFEAKR